MNVAECLCLPDKPIFRSEGERKMWRSLRKKLRPQDVLLHGIHFSDGSGDSEIDILVLMAEGFATIEVKGGRVWLEDAQWLQATPEGIKVIDLEEQAISHKHRLGKYLAARWKHGRVRMQHLVALPDSSIGVTDPSPGLPRSLVIDKGQLPDAAGLVFDSLTIRMQGQPTRWPGDALVQEASELLVGRGDPQEQLAQRISAVDEQVRLLTEEQFLALDLAERVPRVEINGGPGTGKTWLAVEQARRWTAKGDRVGFVCFSRGLAAWVRRTVQDWPDKQRNLLWVGTFHSLGRTWGVEVPADLARDDSDFWENKFPARMAEVSGDAGPRFDALIIDESQDFADNWWPAVMGGLKDPDRGRLMIFSDERQRVFDRESDPLDGLVPLSVKRNMRNTKQIARVFQPLTDDRQDLIGMDGPRVRFMPCSSSQAIQTADDAAVALLDEGWQPRDVVLLTTNHRHPVHRDQVETDGLTDYWSRLWDNDDIFYSTVTAFKGLERQAVVLSVDGFRSPDTARQVLYVGMSRARQQLILCGDPEELLEVGGRELVKRLA